MPDAIGPHLLGVRIAVRLDARTEGIDDAAVVRGPDVEIGREIAVGALDQLQELRRGVQIAVATGIHRVIAPLGLRRGHAFRRPFRQIIVIAALLEAVRDFLREAASSGRNLVARGDFEGRGDNRIQSEGRQRRHRLAPEAMVG